MKRFIKLLLISAGLEFAFQLLKSLSWDPSLPSALAEIINGDMASFLFEWFIVFNILTILSAISIRTRFGFLKPEESSELPKGEYESSAAVTVPRKLFFDRAAWLSFIFPLALAVVTVGLFLPGQARSILVKPDSGILILACEIFIVLAGLIPGIVSILGIERHHRRQSMWIAIMGILMNWTAGCGLALLYILSSLGRNC